MPCGNPACKGDCDVCLAEASSVPTAPPMTTTAAPSGPPKDAPPPPQLSTVKTGFKSAIGKFKLTDRAALSEAKPTFRPAPYADPLRTQNAQREWLTYETTFNNKVFRKTNQFHLLGLYVIELPCVNVWIRAGVDAETLEKLRSWFFPTISDCNMLPALSAEACPWQRPPSSSTPTRIGTPTSSTASRDATSLYLPHRVVMPFNSEDNSSATPAIGARSETPRGSVLRRLRPELWWGFWKTASRSLVAIPEATSKAECLAAEVRSWDWPAADTALPSLALRLPENRGLYERNTRLNPEGEHAFGCVRLGAAIGVKTGVEYVGSNDQRTKKDQLEDDSILACLRSDLIAKFDADCGRRQAESKTLTVLTELLSITEKGTPEQEQSDNTYGDGAQIRDLSALNPRRSYFPPISIPFVDADKRVAFCPRFALCGDKQWRDYWGLHYAVRFGEAKALLLLRYGLQMQSPNAQNLLLEFDGDHPTGRVILRDVGDMYLHRTVLWAKFNGAAQPTPRRSDSPDTFRTVHPLVEAEYVLKEAPGGAWRTELPCDTDREESAFGPPGTRTNWFRFSTLFRPQEGMASDSDDACQGWTQTMATMSEWGERHVRAYVALIDALLKQEMAIKWDRLPPPDPENYRRLDENDEKARQRAYSIFQRELAWEDDISKQIDDILKTAEIRDRIRLLSQNRAL